MKQPQGRAEPTERFEPTIRLGASAAYLLNEADIAPFGRDSASLRPVRSAGTEKALSLPKLGVHLISRAVRAADLSREMPNLRFVITGGPGAGKTTVLRALADRGYTHAAESARVIIRERLASGLSPRPPLAQFGNEILRRDIARYRETRITDHPLFFDRGIVDALCILDQQQAISPGEVEEYVRSFPYNEIVLLMPPWEAIYRTDSERDQTFAQGVQVFEELRTWYARWGYETVEVPRTAIDQRVNFILQTVEYALTRQSKSSST